MRRAYAIGIGAGTQALIQIPPVLLFGNPDADTHALLMGAAWIVNLAVAEWLIRRTRSPARSPAAHRHLSVPGVLRNPRS